MNSRENNFSQKSEKGTARFARAPGQALSDADKMTQQPTNKENTMKPEITITKIRPVYEGDWHDKPCKWEVSKAGITQRQIFTTKKDATRFARLWKKIGFFAAINAF